MNYYITGSHGFIGGHIVGYLQNHNEIVVRLGREAGDWDIDQSKEFTVIHCASYGNHSHQTFWNETIWTNINILEDLLYRGCECQKFYNFSSSSVTLPNQTLYSATKLVGEKIIESLNDPRFVNIRPYSVFGPGEASHRFTPTVIRCLKSGEQMQLVEWPKHDWIYIDSFIDLMFKGVTEIGSGISYSNLEIVLMLESISGKKLNYTPVEYLRSYDCKDWVCPVKNETIIDTYTGLKLTYEASNV